MGAARPNALKTSDGEITVSYELYIDLPKLFAKMIKELELDDTSSWQAFIDAEISQPFIILIFLPAPEVLSHNARR